MSAKDRAKQALLASQTANKRGRAITPCIPAGKSDPGRKRRRHSDPADLATGLPFEAGTPPLVQKMESQAQLRGHQSDLQASKSKKHLSKFEAAFAAIVEHDEGQEKEAENNQRLQNLATSMEWSMIESECKQLAAQVCPSLQVCDVMPHVCLQNPSAYTCCPCSYNLGKRLLV